MCSLWQDIDSPPIQNISILDSHDIGGISMGGFSVDVHNRICSNSNASLDEILNHISNNFIHSVVQLVWVQSQLQSVYFRFACYVRIID